MCFSLLEAANGSYIKLCPELGQSLLPPPPPLHTVCTPLSHTVTYNNLTWRSRNVQLSRRLPSSNHRQQVETFTRSHKRKEPLLWEQEKFSCLQETPTGMLDVWKKKKIAKESRWVPFTNCFQRAQTSDFTSCSIVNSLTWTNWRTLRTFKGLGTSRRGLQAKMYKGTELKFNNELFCNCSDNQLIIDKITVDIPMSQTFAFLCFVISLETECLQSLLHVMFPYICICHDKSFKRLPSDA